MKNTKNGIFGIGTKNKINYSFVASSWIYLIFILEGNKTLRLFYILGRQQNFILDFIL